MKSDELPSVTASTEVQSAPPSETAEQPAVSTEQQRSVRSVRHRVYMTGTGNDLAVRVGPTFLVCALRLDRTC